ncbi:unnamed protein product [Effrenium voratum]|nr:unnamed protein product [Effrenium voratum]
MYGTFRRPSTERRKRRDVGDEDEFPWLVALLFVVILCAYSFVLYGCWDVSTRIQTFGERSSHSLALTAGVTDAMQGVVSQSVDRGEEAIHGGLDRLLIESENAHAEARKLVKILKDNSGHMAKEMQTTYRKLVTLLYAESKRLSLLGARLQFIQQPEAARSLVDSVTGLVNMILPLAAALPNDKQAMIGLMNSTKELQAIFAQMDTSIESVDMFLQDLAAQCDHFISAASLLVNHSMVVEDFQQKVADLPNETSAMLMSFTHFRESQYLRKLYDLDLVNSFDELGPEDQKLVTQAAEALLGISEHLKREVQSSEQMVREAIALVRAGTKKSKAGASWTPELADIFAETSVAVRGWPQAHTGGVQLIAQLVP